MLMSRYTLEQKISALDALKSGDTVEAISQKMNLSGSTLKEWNRQHDDIRREYRQQVRNEADYTMALVQGRMADKAVAMLEAMDQTRIDNAPLNQLASALGVLIDRFLKLQEAQEESDAENTEQVIRYEFRYPDGSLGETPYFAEGRSRHTGAVQSGGVRETLGQDGTGENYTNGKSGLSWDADVVAGSDLSDGESGLARFEDDNDGRDWYHD
jgi:transposase-like protein